MPVIFRTFPYGTTRRAIVTDVHPHLLTLEDDTGEGHFLVGTKVPTDSQVGDVGTLTFIEEGILGGSWQFTRDKPILYLDPSLPIYNKWAVHPGTDVPWDERQHELERLSENPDNAAAYATLQAQTSFHLFPAMVEGTLVNVSPVPGPRFYPTKAYSCNPALAAIWTDEQKAPFDIRESLPPQGRTITFPLPQPFTNPTLKPQ